MSDDLQDLRTVLRSVDAELDHARVLRTVHASRRTTRWVPLAAAAAVACVLLASVGTLAWVTSRDEPVPAVQPATTAPLPDPQTLAERVRVAISAGTACTRIEQDGRVVMEQLRRVGADGPTVLLASPGSDRWPLCAPDRAPTPRALDDVPSGSATRAPSPDLKVATTRDLLGPLAERAPAVSVARDVAGDLVLRVRTARLRYDYRLDAADRPVAVRVRPLDAAGPVLDATVGWG